MPQFKSEIVIEYKPKVIVFGAFFDGISHSGLKQGKEYRVRLLLFNKMDTIIKHPFQVYIFIEVMANKT